VLSRCRDTWTGCITVLRRHVVRLSSVTSARHRTGSGQTVVNWQSAKLDVMTC